MRDHLARHSGGYALLVVAAWVIAAGIANLAVPQRSVELHARSFMPADAPSSISAREAARHFGDAPGDNLNYIVLERDGPLTAQDRRFYDHVVTVLAGRPRARGNGDRPVGWWSWARR